MLTINYLHKFFDFVQDNNWFDDYNFWLSGSFPKVVKGELLEVCDMDIGFVNKNNCHNKKEITTIIHACKKYMEDIDICYRPSLNTDLQERGLDAIWTSNQFWGDEKTWPTKQNYQAWRVKRYRPSELWYLIDKELIIEYKLWPLEKHIERVIDGLEYAKPILLNNYLKEEKYHDSTC